MRVNTKQQALEGKIKMIIFIGWITLIQTPKSETFQILKTCWVLPDVLSGKFHAWCHSQSTGKLKTGYKITFRLCGQVKYTWIFCWDLGSISQDSVLYICKYSTIWKKNLKSETLLVPNISGKGYSKCIHIYRGILNLLI